MKRELIYVHNLHGQKPHVFGHRYGKSPILHEPGSEVIRLAQNAGSLFELLQDTVIKRYLKITVIYQAYIISS